MGTMSMDSMGRVGGAGAANVEDEAEVLSSLCDETVSFPVDKDWPVEDS